TGKSTRLTPAPAPSSDFYSFSLNAGQSASVGLRALTTGNLILELQDAGGNVLATGRTGATNLSRVINNFVTPADGTYYLRVAGASVLDGGKDYSLVVTRGVDFSTEPNDSLATAQDIRGTGGVLGFVGGADATDFFRAATLNEGQTIHLLSSTP